MSGHTTGPWRVEGAYVVGAAGVIVRQAAPYSEAPDDLRLIAAAPELLEALVALTSPICSEEEDAEAHRLARAAIAAATGETK